MSLNFTRITNWLTRTLLQKTPKSIWSNQSSNLISNHSLSCYTWIVNFCPLHAAQSHRREVIEDLLDINIFSNMNSLLKDRVRTAQGQSKDCGHLLNLAEEKVVSQEKLIASLEEVNDTDKKKSKIKLPVINL